MLTEEGDVATPPVPPVGLGRGDRAHPTVSAADPDRETLIARRTHRFRERGEAIVDRAELEPEGLVLALALVVACSQRANEPVTGQPLRRRERERGDRMRPQRRPRDERPNVDSARRAGDRTEQRGELERRTASAVGGEPEQVVVHEHAVEPGRLGGDGDREHLVDVADERRQRQPDPYVALAHGTTSRASTA